MRVNFQLFLLFFIVLLGSSFLFGDLLHRLTRAPVFTPMRSILCGFTLNLAIYGTIYTIVSLAPDRINSLRVVGVPYFIIFAVLFIISILSFIKNKGFKDYATPELRALFRVKWLYLLIAIIVVITFVNSVLDFSPSTDGYFVSISTEIYETWQIPRGASYYSWSSFIALISRLTRNHPTALAYTFLPLIITPLGFMSYFSLGKRFFKDPNHLIFYMFVIVTLHVFSGYATYTQGHFLMLHSWQGSGIMASIIFPLILCLSIDIYRGISTSYTLSAASILLLAGSTICATGKYLVPTYFVICLIPLIISKIVNKDLKASLICLRNIVIPIIPSLLPMIDSALMPPLQGADKLYYSGFTTPNLSDVFSHSLFSGFYFILFLVAYAFMLVLEKDAILRLMFSGMVPIVFITLLNPVLVPFMTRFITGTKAYGQVYWMIPIFPLIAYVSARYSLIFRRKALNAFIFAIIFFGLILGGRFIYEPGVQFNAPNNPYNIPDEAIAATEKLVEISEDGAICLFPLDIARFPQQCTSRVRVARDETGNFKKEYLLSKLKRDGVDFVYMRHRLQGDYYNITEVKGYGYLVEL